MDIDATPDRKLAPKKFGRPETYPQLDTYSDKLDAFGSEFVLAVLVQESRCLVANHARLNSGELF